MTGSGFVANPEAMRGVAGNLAGILVPVLGEVGRLDGLRPRAAAFARIGARVAQQHDAARTAAVARLRSLLHELRTVTDDVHRAADRVESGDREVAARYRETDSRLAALTASRGSGGPGAGVQPISDYLAGGGLGRPGPEVVTASDLMSWLHTNPRVVHVYSGPARLGGAVPGDIWVAPPDTVAVAGADGTLYHRGPVTLPSGSWVEVFRPIGETSSL